jgi:hypothetical protein
VGVVLFLLYAFFDWEWMRRWKDILKKKDEPIVGGGEGGRQDEP